MSTTQRSRKIYVASSWRNERQPAVVERLQDVGHSVYDFRNPRPGDWGFHWSDIDPEWEQWSPEKYREALQHPIVRGGFTSDMSAMKWADTFVLVLPCGRSAHLELGWACGMGKNTMILLDKVEPEVMVAMVDHICVSLDEVCDILSW